MKRSIRIVAAIALALAGAAHADDKAGLVAVEALARINGQALACSDAAAARRAKALALAYTPKTGRYSSLFEETTQQSFLDQTRAGAAACPAAALFTQRLDGATRVLSAAFGAPAAHPAASAAEPAPRSAPRYLLQGPRGRAVTSEDFRGRFQLVAFGFVSCPDVCPTTLLEMKETLDALGDRAARLQPLFVTVDPQRDVPAVLEAYTAAFDARIVGLGGDPALVARAADAFGVKVNFVREPGAAPGTYTVEHSVGVYLIGPDGQYLERIAYGTPVRDIVRRVQTWMDAAAQ